ncbi:MAG: hypothetical protein AAB373_06800 [Patescibacteria group bacterium]
MEKQEPKIPPLETQESEQNHEANDQPITETDLSNTELRAEEEGERMAKKAMDQTKFFNSRIVDMDEPDRPNDVLLQDGVHWDKETGFLRLTHPNIPPKPEMLAHFSRNLRYDCVTINGEYAIPDQDHNFHQVIEKNGKYSINKNPITPKSGMVIREFDLIPNRDIQKLIQKFGPHRIGIVD